MLVSQLLPFTKNLSARKWTDEDIVEDIKFLKEELSARFQSLTTYDEWTSELESGHLSWTPVHESEEFWKENAVKLNEKEYHYLKYVRIPIGWEPQVDFPFCRKLVSLLDSEDPIVLAVASHDIGQYVKYYERGRK